MNSFIFTVSVPALRSGSSLSGSNVHRRVYMYIHVGLCIHTYIYASTLALSCFQLIFVSETRCILLIGLVFVSLAKTTP